MSLISGDGEGRMIRILKPGNENIAVCNRCGCAFAFEKEDTHEVDVCASEKVRISQSYVKCPECGYDIWVEK